MRQARVFYIAPRTLALNVQFCRHKKEPLNKSEALFCARRELNARPIG